VKLRNERHLENRAIQVFREDSFQDWSISLYASGEFMRNSNKFIIGLVILVIVIGLGIYLNRKPSQASPQPPPTPAVAKTQSTPRPSVHVQAPTAVAIDTPVRPGQTLVEIPREKVEDYLRRHNRDAASLLAAFHVLHDTNLLNEAATNFPNDPHLQWTILAEDAFPADRRKWLDAFKASSRSNSLANYLSAQDYFKNSQPEAAMKEMAAAASKSQFADYSMESILDAEDLYRSSGTPDADTHTGAMSTVSDDLHQLSEFKDLARALQDLQHQYANSGDSKSIQALAQMGIEFANRIATGDDGKFPINQLVANATQAIVIESLDQNTSYDFLGGETPAQRQAEFKQQRAELRDLNTKFTAATAVATEEQMNGYWDRSKIYGGWPAMQWLVRQTATTPNSGN